MSPSPRAGAGRLRLVLIAAAAIALNAVLDLALGVPMALRWMIVGVTAAIVGYTLSRRAASSAARA